MRTHVEIARVGPRKAVNVPNFHVSCQFDGIKLEERAKRVRAERKGGILTSETNGLYIPSSSDNAGV